MSFIFLVIFVIFFVLFLCGRKLTRIEKERLNYGIKNFQRRNRVKNIAKDYGYDDIAKEIKEYNELLKDD